MIKKKVSLTNGTHDYWLYETFLDLVFWQIFGYITHREIMTTLVQLPINL